MINRSSMINRKPSEIEIPTAKPIYISAALAFVISTKGSPVDEGEDAICISVNVYSCAVIKSKEQVDGRGRSCEYTPENTALVDLVVHSVPDVRAAGALARTRAAAAAEQEAAAAAEKRRGGSGDKGSSRQVDSDDEYDSEGAEAEANEGCKDGVEDISDRGQVQGSVSMSDPSQMWDFPIGSRKFPELSKV